MLRRFFEITFCAALLVAVADLAKSDPANCDKPCKDLQAPQAKIECYTWEIESCTLDDRSLAFVYSARGGAYHDLKQYDDAISDYDTAIRILPYPRVFLKRGITMMYLRKPNLALVDFDRAIEEIPTWALAYKNRANAHYALGNRQAAIDDLRKADEYGDPNAKNLLKKLGVE